MTAALAAVPKVVLAILVLPVLAGLAGTLLPAFGWLPALGATEPGLAPWRALAATPGIGHSAALSLGTGLAATAIAFAATMLIVARFQGTRSFRLVRRLLSPFLSVPHAAAAFGLAFVIAPSGWIARLLSPWATGWTVPPDWLIVSDRWGLALIAGLVVKEIPFLLLMTLAALPQADAERGRQVAMSLGYGPVTGWVKAVLPRVYPQIRLPVYAVLAYAVSAVEVAIILGPTTPAPLAVRLTAWMRDPDLALWSKAAAGAVLQVGLVLVAFAIWRAGEALAARALAAWTHRGGRDKLERIGGGAAAVVAALAVAPLALGILGLAVWSVAGLWAFPETLPQSFSLHPWQQALPGLAAALPTTLGLAAGATALSVALVVASLEAGTRSGRAPWSGGLALLYLPLLVPQVAFLFGLQIIGIAAGIDGRIAGVLMVHVVFVLPYVHLSLADPWRALDPRYALVAATLGAGPARSFVAVRLPLLLSPVLTAAAVGFAVSIGLYLPTLLVGGGRVSTLTTEAVALAAGGDRRLIGVYGLSQTLLPLLGFAAALALPAIVFRNRRGMRGAG